MINGKANSCQFSPDTSAVFLLILLLLPAAVASAEKWPGEEWNAAVNLTHLDHSFKKNLSGACWNPDTRQFWVCRNGGPSAFWALEDDGKGSFRIAVDENGKEARFQTNGGDFEGICQADYSSKFVYLMVEGADQVREYDISVFGKPKLNMQWNIGAHVPTSGRAGSEGITFVPNNWLEHAGFVDEIGRPYIATNGMGGIMLVAHQKGGRLYAFDLDPESSRFHFVGSYRTSRNESSGLEFDRSTGLLYVWHNTGPNYLEITDLTSKASGKERTLNRLAEYSGPKGGNLEGIAITSAKENRNWCLITDDDCQDGAALMWFRNFKPAIPRAPQRKP